MENPPTLVLSSSLSASGSSPKLDERDQGNVIERMLGRRYIARGFYYFTDGWVGLGIRDRKKFYFTVISTASQI